MKIKFLFTAILSILLAAGGTVVAGPGDKGKGSVIIRHATSPEKVVVNEAGDEVIVEGGSVDIEVSLPAAISHIDKHEDDCVVEGGDDVFHYTDLCGLLPE